MSCAFSFAKFHFQSEGSCGREHSGECEGLLFVLVFGVHCVGIRTRVVRGWMYIYIYTCLYIYIH